MHTISPMVVSALASILMFSNLQHSTSLNLAALHTYSEGYWIKHVYELAKTPRELLAPTTVHWYVGLAMIR